MYQEYVELQIICSNLICKCNLKESLSNLKEKFVFQFETNHDWCMGQIVFSFSTKSKLALVINKNKFEYFCNHSKVEKPFLGCFLNVDKLHSANPLICPGTMNFWKIYKILKILLVNMVAQRVHQIVIRNYVGLYRNQVHLQLHSKYILEIKCAHKLG